MYCAMTFSIMTLTIMILSINGLFAKFSIINLSHYAECCILFIVMQIIILLSVFMLNVVVLSVMAPNVQPKTQCQSKCAQPYVLIMDRPEAYIHRHTFKLIWPYSNRKRIKMF
jgi:hypothetical protein